MRLSRALFRSWARSPLVGILFAIAIVHAIGIGWGLPASDGWDNDGVAPRDFLPGLAATFTPGSFYTYPPVHLALLAVLTLPITLVGFFRAASTAVPDLISELLRVGYMTSIAYVARVVSLVMSLGVVLFVARIAEEIRAAELGVAPPSIREDARVRTAGYAAAAFVGTNATLTYYAHTSNLDVPYAFWATWSLLGITRAIARNEPRRLRSAFALAAVAIGTKDQAYALFVPSVPAALGLWLLEKREKRENSGKRRPEAKQVVREIVVAAALALVLLLFIDVAWINPSGFRARLAFLRGSASMDYVEYTDSWAGRVDVLVDGVRKSTRQFPALVWLFVPLGLARMVVAVRRGLMVALAILPLLVALSFTLMFNWVARRTDARFFFPQALALAVYGGLGVDLIVTASSAPIRIFGRVAAAIALAYGAFRCVSVDANLLGDPRYDAERWLAKQVRRGDSIETYGPNVYMPRMPSDAQVTRVGPDPLEHRNRIPGVREIQAPFEDAPSRGARFLVVSTAWVWRYEIGGRSFDSGRQLAPMQARTVRDEPSVRFFDGLLRGDGDYAMAHDSGYDDRLFPEVDIHGTTGRSVWIFERKAP